MRSAARTSKGFTLVELLVVISIIAILAIIGLTVYSGLRTSARDSRRMADVDAIRQALEIHYDMDTGIYPNPVQNDWFAGGSKPMDGSVDYEIEYETDDKGFKVCADLEKVGGWNGTQDDFCKYDQST